MTRNIAIVGKMYAGKTTLATQLVNDHGYTRVAMAGPLKALAHLAYGEVVEKDKEYATTSLDDGSVSFKSGRRIYQQIGQSLKQVDRDIWLKCFINDTRQMGREPYVVDDVRFVFEAEYLREEGWYIVSVSTPEAVRVQRAVEANGKPPTKEELNHESEAEVDRIKYDALYDGTLPLKLLGQQAESILYAAEHEA